ncbi:uncharacterized protein LOC129715258 isoform X1 [Leucoraja erinacea]|uniref:uncharacterized protein LOC129715258 isoform X1 n=1 Tax=Leucoraja erinaceus TaxID=7782 RepID=UPI002458E693|nr:uncharacterized protein LOC129715258 isoform X1 [Leucoraja erinacea]
MQLESGTTITWSVLHPSVHSVILVHTFGTTDVHYGDFYQLRVLYNMTTASLQLLNADLADSGIYETLISYPGLDGKKSHYHSILYIQEMLKVPLIIQTRIDINQIIRLKCIVKNGETDTILWLKSGVALRNSKVYKISPSNRTVSFSSARVANCETYTCVIKNKISENHRSHVLLIEGLMDLHQYSFVLSVLSLVSTITTFCASAFIIFYALGAYRVHKRHVQLTALFVLFQLISFVFLLVASLFCLVDPNFSTMYKVLEGLIFVTVLTMIVYVLLIYLQPENQLKRSFLLKRYQRNIFLVYEICAIFLSSIPLYQGQRSLKNCGQSEEDVVGVAATTLVIYLYVVGVPFLIFVKYMRSWRIVRRLSRVPSRLN